MREFACVLLGATFASSWWMSIMFYIPAWIIINTIISATIVIFTIIIGLTL